MPEVLPSEAYKARCVFPFSFSLHFPQDLGLQGGCSPSACGCVLGKEEASARFRFLFVCGCG